MLAEFNNGKLKLTATCGEEKSFLERMGKFNYIEKESSMVSLEKSFIILVDSGLQIGEINEMLNTAKKQLDSIIRVCDKEREKITSTLIKEEK